MSLCNSWLCCCSRPSTSSSPTTPQPNNANHGIADVEFQRHANNTTAIEIVTSNFQKVSTSSVGSGQGLGEIHITCHPVYDTASRGSREGSPLQRAVHGGPKNGRKVSPLGHDYPTQHAVVKQRIGDSAIISLSTAHAPTEGPTKTLPNAADPSTAPNGGGGRRCPIASIQGIQDSFQKFSDFCSSAFGGLSESPDKLIATKDGGCPRNIGAHKFSLEQKSNLEENEAALAKRWVGYCRGPKS